MKCLKQSKQCNSKVEQNYLTRSKHITNKTSFLKINHYRQLPLVKHK